MSGALLRRFLEGAHERLIQLAERKAPKRPAYNKRTRRHVSGEAFFAFLRFRPVERSVTLRADSKRKSQNCVRVSRRPTKSDYSPQRAHIARWVGDKTMQWAPSTHPAVSAVLMFCVKQCLCLPETGREHRVLKQQLTERVKTPTKLDCGSQVNLCRLTKQPTPNRSALPRNQYSLGH
jgi:hypothetical protein